MTIEFLKTELSAAQTRIVQLDSEVADKDQRNAILIARVKILEEKLNKDILDKYFPHEDLSTRRPPPPTDTVTTGGAAPGPSQSSTPPVQRIQTCCSGKQSSQQLSCSCSSGCCHSHNCSGRPPMSALHCQVNSNCSNQSHSNVIQVEKQDSLVELSNKVDIICSDVRDLKSVMRKLQNDFLTVNEVTPAAAQDDQNQNESLASVEEFISESMNISTNLN